VNNGTVAYGVQKQVPRETLMTKIGAALTGQVGTFVIGSVTNIILARVLGPSGKGLYSLAVLAATTVMTLTHLSMANANTHYINKEQIHRPALIGNSLMIIFVWGMLVTLLGLLFFDSFAHRLFPELNRQLWGLAMAAVVPLLLFEIAGGLVLGLDRQREYSVALIAKEGLMLLLALWLYYANILTAGSAAAVWVLSVMFTGFYQLGLVWKVVGRGVTISWDLLKGMAGYSAQSHIANVTSFLRLRFDMFLVAGFLNAQEVGYYGVAVSLIGLLWFIPTAIAQVLVPYISQRDEETANDVTPRLCRISFAIALVGGLILAALGKPIIWLLFGKPYLPAYPSLLVLLPGALFYGIAKMLAGDLLGRGLPRHAMVISGIAFAANLLINLLVIPYWGIVGAALSATITQILVGVLFIRAFTRSSLIPAGELFAVRREDFYILWHADKRR